MAQERQPPILPIAVGALALVVLFMAAVQGYILALIALPVIAVAAIFRKQVGAYLDGYSSRTAGQEAKEAGSQEVPPARKLTPEERAAEWSPSWKRQMANDKKSSKTGCIVIIILFLLLIAFCNRGKSVREGADCLERQDAVRNLGAPNYNGRCNE
jgi:hypothetical protein